MAKLDLVPLHFRLEPNSYSYIQLQKAPYNIDKIDVEIYSNGNKETLTIPAFSNSKIDFPERSSMNGLIATYSFPQNAQTRFMLEILSTNKCYQSVTNISEIVSQKNL